MIFILFTLTIVLSSSIYAKGSNENLSVYLGGESIGIDLHTEVYVTGKFDVETDDNLVNPWEKSDIEKGDVIYSFDKKRVVSIEQLYELLNTTTPGEKEIVIKRNNKYITTTIKVIKNKIGKNSIGLYVKDNILGVGTITYINQENIYGALGHSITSMNNLDIIKGNLTFSNVQSVRKAIPGIPGEKRASLDNEVIGTINRNTEFGIFGQINNDIRKDDLIVVANQNEIKIGNAQIVTVIEGTKKEFFDIEIVELKKQNNEDIKGIKFKVTDPQLLNKTSGIIQGMSGSPIIQKNKLIGAVSHVIIDNPDFGYGVYIDWMLQNDDF